MTWKDDDELFKLIRSELFSAVVGDIMDKLGYFHQFLSPKIVPLRDDMVVVGRAMPVLEADSFGEISPSEKNPVMSKPFGLMLEALDDLKKNEVYICTGSSPEYALWGELMSARALQCGAVGAVVDGYSRDTSGILNLDFPMFSYGRYAQDQGPRGKVIDYRVPIEINGVYINPGDIIFGDMDGVCVIPRKIEKEVVKAALEKARGEKVVLKAIQNGMSATDAFAKYGIM
ncbi:RraA family protein [Ulvibacterium marinum]|uniref:Putative 4-hydroxy-4-methyl-2-oxoglutarate aldolase n=1 Tax=Ulvibacterium marinum TaxID=2419782 RepID=A0A3B0BYQ6_9FLAO|nr:RraA family protein [Ulvibacterium marinum]RKN78763.1 RraA family protein [Ulvibacterium marinum]